MACREHPDIIMGTPHAIYRICDGELGKRMNHNTRSPRRTRQPLFLSVDDMYTKHRRAGKMDFSRLNGRDRKKEMTDLMDGSTLTVKHIVLTSLFHISALNTYVISSPAIVS